MPARGRGSCVVSIDSLRLRLNVGRVDRQVRVRVTLYGPPVLVLECRADLDVEVRVVLRDGSSSLHRVSNTQCTSHPES